MEKSKLDQIVETLKETLNKALIELDVIENSDGYRDQTSTLRYDIQILLDSPAMKSEEEFEEYSSSEDYSSSY